MHSGATTDGPSTLDLSSSSSIWRWVGIGPAMLTALPSSRLRRLSTTYAFTRTDNSTRNAFQPPLFRRRPFRRSHAVRFSFGEIMPHRFTFLFASAPLLVASLCSAQSASDTRLRVSSPDGQVVFILSDAPHTHAMDAASDNLRYAVDFHGKWL